MTGVVNTLATNTLASTTSILGGDLGTIIVGIAALTLIGVLVYKFRSFL